MTSFRCGSLEAQVTAGIPPLSTTRGNISVTSLSRWPTLRHIRHRQCTVLHRRRMVLHLLGLRPEVDLRYMIRHRRDVLSHLLRTFLDLLYGLVLGPLRLLSLGLPTHRRTSLDHPSLRLHLHPTLLLRLHPTLLYCRHRPRATTTPIWTPLRLRHTRFLNLLVPHGLLHPPVTARHLRPTLLLCRLHPRVTTSMVSTPLRRRHTFLSLLLPNGLLHHPATAQPLHPTLLL